MRVISGEKKGFKLRSPKGVNTRPTEDRIKESLFNILRDIHNESVVLDLFAGSGGIGIEFLSRGAKKTFFVDKSYESIECIKDNLVHTDYILKSEVIKKDAFRALKEFNEKGIRFNYIFADPPYEKGLALKTLETIDNMDILKKDGLLIIEHEINLNLDIKPLSKLSKKDYRKYGSKAISFYIY
ncbi:MAG: 16S rRNA (guanine(966)-N(2))-methyltransferase RsmD [Tissierellia bacterium]|nr:16S rRNA (guanine(966)-N(2))-methyltransferase RsmD [Tissierellia bacterium]